MKIFHFPFGHYTEVVTYLCQYWTNAAHKQSEKATRPKGKHSCPTMVISANSLRKLPAATWLKDADTNQQISSQIASTRYLRCHGEEEEPRRAERDKEEGASSSRQPDGGGNEPDVYSAPGRSDWGHSE